MKRKAFRAAFPYTIPIFAGFWFLGLTYGIYMNVSGFSFWYPMIMSLTIFGGSLEFVAVSMLLAPYAPVQVFIMTLMIQARHLFYGISMLDKFKGLGWKKAYLIFGMCDETFSINYTAEIPEDVDRGWFYFFVTLLNYFYWFSGATLGGLLGGLILSLIRISLRMGMRVLHNCGMHVHGRPADVSGSQTDQGDHVRRNDGNDQPRRGQGGNQSRRAGKKI